MLKLYIEIILPLGQEVILCPEVYSRATPSPGALQHRKVKEKRILKVKPPDAIAELSKRDLCSFDSESEYGCHLKDLPSDVVQVTENLERQGDDIITSELDNLPNHREMHHWKTLLSLQKKNQG